MSNEGQTESWRGQGPEPPPPPDVEGEQEHQQGGQVPQHPLLQLLLALTLSSGSSGEHPRALLRSI